jgi:hypothetical protein
MSFAQHCRTLDHRGNDAHPPTPGLVDDFALIQTLKQVDGMYHTQRNSRNAFTTAFFQPSNLQGILNELGRRLTEHFKENTRVPPTKAFAAFVVDQIAKNKSLQSKPHMWHAINFANNFIVQHEFAIHVHSIRQKKLHHKYFFALDRIRVFPRAQQAGTLNGEVAIDSSKYSLTHPDTKRYRQFLDEITFDNRNM